MLKAITVFFQRWLFKRGVSLRGQEGRNGVGKEKHSPLRRLALAIAVLGKLVVLTYRPLAGGHLPV